MIPEPILLWYTAKYLRGSGLGSSFYSFEPKMWGYQIVGGGVDKFRGSDNHIIGVGIEKSIHKSKVRLFS